MLKELYQGLSWAFNSVLGQQYYSSDNAAQKRTREEASYDTDSSDDYSIENTEPLAKRIASTEYVANFFKASGSSFLFGSDASSLTQDQQLQTPTPDQFVPFVIEPTPEQRVDSSSYVEPSSPFCVSESTPTQPQSPLGSEQLTANQLTKEAIIKILEEAFHIKLSYKVLTDITLDESTVQFTSVGRPDTVAARKQMRHVIPFSFVHKLISGMIEDSTHPSEILTKLIKPALAFTKLQKGFALTSDQLETEEYGLIRQNSTDKHNRSMHKEGIKTFFYSPSKGDALFPTPSKKAKAAEDFSAFHTQYVKKALESLLEQIKHDANTHILASEILTRLMFTIFNNNEHACFAKEGNTAIYEIRLYQNPEEAKLPSEATYEVLTARELEIMLQTTDAKELNECIRIVNCEGSKIREIHKALKTVDKICDTEGDHSEHIETYNEKYNYQLKLSNCDITSNYNNPITVEDYKSASSYHIAKLLYSSFDLKALEDLVFAHQINELPVIIVFTTATGERAAEYQIIKGAESRKRDKNSEIDCSSDSVFRDKETDSKILPKKLAELFTIGTMSLKHINIMESLNQLIILAAQDHEITKATGLDAFQDEVLSVYRELTDDLEPTEVVNNLATKLTAATEGAAIPIIGDCTSSDTASDITEGY